MCLSQSFPQSICSSELLSTSILANPPPSSPFDIWSIPWRRCRCTLDSHPKQVSALIVEMLPFVLISRLVWLLLPAVSLAHPAQRDGLGDIAASQLRSLSTLSSYSNTGDVAAPQNVARGDDGILHDFDSKIIAKRQLLLPIDAPKFSSLTPDTFNLTEAPPGQFNSSGSGDIDELISFDEKIPLPIWPAIYFRVLSSSSLPQSPRTQR